MPESASIERRKMMRFLGAKVIITPASEAGSGAYKKAKELADENGWFYARQFENEANANIHELTTGQEIVSDFKETSLDYWVSGYGTGGTFSGVARTLRESMPETKLIMAEPDVAPLVAHGTSQKRTDDGAPASSHPSAYLTQERYGKGQIILFSGEPNFRGSSLGTNRLWLNSVVYGSGLGTSSRIKL